MAMVCTICGSADTQAMLDTFQCLNCGALTSFATGEAAPHVEYSSSPEPITVVIPSSLARAGAVESAEGYVEGATIEIPSAEAETTDPPEPAPVPGPPAGEVPPEAAPPEEAPPAEG